MQPEILLAKEAIEKYITEGRIISPQKDLPKRLLEKKSGVFVTIMEDKKLKGCIGTYLPTKSNIAEEIISNAIAAATEDFRFNPVSKEDLTLLSYTVSILNPPERVKDIKELDPKLYGIIVKTFDEAEPYKTKKAGLLLPDLEGVNTIAKQISICCAKAGIDPKKEKLAIFRFTVEKYQ